MPCSRYRIYEEFSPHFLTCTVVNWYPLFNDPDLIEILYSSLCFMQKHNRVTVYAYVFMKTHLHLLASSENLSQEIANLKSFTARRIIDTLKVKEGRPVDECLTITETASALGAASQVRDIEVLTPKQPEADTGDDPVVQEFHTSPENLYSVSMDFIWSKPRCATDK